MIVGESVVSERVGGELHLWLAATRNCRGMVDRAFGVRVGVG